MPSRYGITDHFSPCPKVRKNGALRDVWHDAYASGRFRQKMGRRLGDDADFEDKGAEEGGAHSSTNGRLASALRDAISEAPVGAQVEMTVPKMKDLLERSGLGPAAVARLDSHIRKGSPLHDDWHKGDRLMSLASCVTHDQTCAQTRVPLLALLSQKHKRHLPKRSNLLILFPHDFHVSSQLSPRAALSKSKGGPWVVKIDLGATVASPRPLSPVLEIMDLEATPV